ncbi:MAG: acetyl-CoA hydrolase/transferase C-terminal domain-containing protein [Candidatus Saccharimonas sp.]
MSALYTVRFGDREVDVTALVEFLDTIHAERSDPHEYLRIVVPAASSQPELAIATIVQYASRWTGVRVLGMHYTQVYHIDADAPVEFYSPYFSGADRKMYFGADPGVESHLHVIDRSFARIGAAYEAVQPHAIITQVTVRMKSINGLPHVSMGASADYTHRLIMQTAIPLFVLQNTYQPWLNGNLVCTDRIDASMSFDHHMHETPKAKKSSQQVAIMECIARSVSVVMRQIDHERGGEGLSVQMGVGVLPDFIVGMATESIGRVYSEVITNSMRQLPRGTPITGTLVLGDQSLFDWVDDNPFVHLLGVEITNSGEVAKKLGLISIIQAMKVTLDGSTIVGVRKRHSGPGGAPDFGHSAGATHFIVLPAARYDAKGSPTDSNIVLGADPLDFKVLNGFDRPEYLVTEFGVARLTPHVREDGTVFMGTAEDVAEAIIEVAHPAFRDVLRREAAQAKITHASRILTAVS